MKNPSFRFVFLLVLVLLLDFAGDFEDEDDDENEEDGGSGIFHTGSSGRFTVGNFLGLGVSAMYSGLGHAEAA